MIEERTGDAGSLRENEKNEEMSVHAPSDHALAVVLSVLQRCRLQKFDATSVLEAEVIAINF